MKIRLFFAFILCFFFAHSALAFWVWTPESKKWTNPKFAPKESPQEQLAFAQSYYKAEDYESAMREFKKLLKYYPDAVEAPEAQFHVGLCLEEMGKYYEAYQAFQKVIAKYPFSARTQDILEREYIVAQKLLDYRTSFVGIDMTGENAAVEVFRQIIENAPYGKYAAASQYKIGLVNKAKGFFEDATKEFQKVVDNYPESEWAEPAKFQIALCADRSSLDAAYDQTLTEEAKEKFREFITKHPDAELSQQATERIGALRDKEAESQYLVGQFYEKQRAFKSARIYYNHVIQAYPKSPWAVKALERIQTLERERL
ncbi:MAG: outer membrane protein assembly factor BamD [Deltaproteobacteria bacterium]